MTPVTAGRWAGALFLSAFLLYGVGSALVIGNADREDAGALATGALLVVLNSAAVVAIGALATGPAGPLGGASGALYLGARIAEGVLLAAGSAAVLALSRSGPALNAVAYGMAMTLLGIGSLWLCRGLWSARVVAAPVAVWGAAGYALLAGASIAGLASELGGVPPLGVAVSTVLLLPGGLFEVTLGVLLLVRGFRPLAADGPRPSAPMRGSSVPTARRT